LDEQQLIARALAGEAAAERALYDTHVERIYRLAFRMTGDETMAEDCTQETFIKAFDRLADFRGLSLFSTWLHAIGTSVVLNSLRKIKRIGSRETAIDHAPPAAAAVGATDMELSITLHAAIDDLPENLRLVFVMHDLEGYKHHEIAEILDVPVGTSKTRLMRAREELRSALTAGPSRPLKEERQ
jgi:RNA polymerase sigma-70 factor (ECF subfamily)